ncbi:MAG: alpha/beta hydrolase [Casimicrobiaceae bacterium]
MSTPSTLDPALARYFEHLARDFPPLPPEPTPLDRRVRLWALTALGRTPWPAEVTVNDVQLATPVGRIPVRLFYGHDGADEAVPTIVYFHGGGWVCGDTDTHAGICARLAQDARALVASVDYPLAPEADWQTITAACHAAAVAIAADRQASAPGAPFVLAGDSAGAHLAAVTAITARDQGAPFVTALGLFYPCIAPVFDSESYERFAMGPGLTRADMQWYWRHYAGADLELDDYRIAPSRAASLAGLPPMYVVTAGCDPLADDGRAWVERVRAHGVAVVHDEFEGLPHGFLRMGKYSPAVEAAITHLGQRLGGFLRDARS